MPQETDMIMISTLVNGKDIYALEILPEKNKFLKYIYELSRPFDCACNYEAIRPRLTPIEC